MCAIHPGMALLAQKQRERAMLEQLKAEQLRNRRRAIGSRTPYQDELAAQLERVRREKISVYEVRWFYCAGHKWQASVRVDDDAGS